MYVWSCGGVGKKEVGYKRVGLYYGLRMNKRIFKKKNLVLFYYFQSD